MGLMEQGDWRDTFVAPPPELSREHGGRRHKFLVPRLRLFRRRVVGCRGLRPAGAERAGGRDPRRSCRGRAGAAPRRPPSLPPHEADADLPALRTKRTRMCLRHPRKGPACLSGSRLWHPACLPEPLTARLRQLGGGGGAIGARGRDETCPVSTGRRTRRVQLVQERGGGAIGARVFRRRGCRPRA